jgi:DNA replication and repair protein RecF
MRLASLELADFRNLEGVHLEPGERFNLIYGDNAAGKTNLLESIYLVAFLKSFRTRRNRDLIRWDTEAARVSALIEDQGIESRVNLNVKPGERVVTLDGKRVRSPMAYYGLLTAVLFGPDDLELTKGPPEVRRRYLDRILFVSDPGYWKTMRAYNEALQSRNKLLQSGNTDVRLFRSFEVQLAEQGLAVLRRRQQITERVEAVVSELLQVLAHWKGSGLELAYAPSVKPVAWTMETYLALLDERRMSDARRGFTSLGPHKDDINLRFANGKSFRNFASQGQHRLVSILLKITEMEVLRQQKGSTPILLLDDVSSELDKRHYELFKTYMGEGGGQVFLTTTDREVLPQGADIHYYRVAGGQIDVS